MDKKNLNFGIIGLGYWGPNYARIVSELPNAKLLWCADLSDANIKKIKEKYPDTKLTKDYKEIAQDNELDAVIIATPVNTHHEIAKHFLQSGKHVLLEKPFTEKVLEAEDLISTADDAGLTLAVGHVYLFNPGVKALKDLIDNGKLGDVYYIKTDRIGLGPIRKSASALWDLATHDISIALYLLNKDVERVSVEGGDYIQDGVEDFVSLNLRFPDNVFVNICASWYAPEKTRKIVVVGSKGMAVFDDMNTDEMLKFYARGAGADVIASAPAYEDHLGVISLDEAKVLPVVKAEPLKEQVKHFIDCVEKEKKPLADGRNGRRVVEVLVLAEEKLRN